MRVLIATTRIGAAVGVFFGVQQFLIAHDALWLGYVNLASAVLFLLIPQHAIGQHPARLDRRTPEEPGARHHRRQV
jgi:hypothetical protein